MSSNFYSANDAVKHAINELKQHGQIFNAARWQGQSLSQDEKAHSMIEVNHIQLKFPMHDIRLMQQMLKPNLPWADDHFKERVCGMPINPGVEHGNWPWSRRADSTQEAGKFNHNYMERYWPQYAGYGTPTKVAGDYPEYKKMGLRPHQGIYGPYGDLQDVVNVLAWEPSSRQIYLPIWFPEDTHSGNKGRKPCSIGYHFLLRGGKLDITYTLRSCDAYRHMRDDIYLTYLLADWVLERAKEMNAQLADVELGRMVMNITNLHCFYNDYTEMFGDTYENIKG